MSAKKVLEKIGIRQKPKASKPAGRFAGIEDLLRVRHQELASAKTEREVDWARARALGTLDAAHELGFPASETELAKLKKAAKLAYEAAREWHEHNKGACAVAAVTELHRTKMERDFWVEQARQLQNQLQQAQALNANLTEFLARTSDGITPDDIRAMLSDLTAALREPVVGVEAVRALTAQLSGGGQGAYTALKTPARDKLLGMTPR